MAPTSSPWPCPPPSTSPGSNFSSLFAAQNGDLWFSGDRGTAWYHDQKWRTFASTDGSAPDSVVGFRRVRRWQDLGRHPGKGLGV